jgi:hypothetical protein
MTRRTTLLATLTLAAGCGAVHLNVNGQGPATAATPTGPAPAAARPAAPAQQVTISELPAEPLVIQVTATAGLPRANMANYPADPQIVLHVTRPLPALRIRALGGADTKLFVATATRTTHSDGGVSVHLEPATLGEDLPKPDGEYEIRVTATADTGVVIYAAGAPLALDRATTISPLLPAQLPVAARGAYAWYPYLDHALGRHQTFDEEALRTRLFVTAPPQLLVSPTEDLTAEMIETRPFDGPTPKQGEALLPLRPTNGTYAEVVTADGRVLKVDARFLGDLAPAATTPDPAQLTDRPESFAVALRLAPADEQKAYAAVVAKLATFERCYTGGTVGLNMSWRPDALRAEAAAKRCGVTEVGQQRDRATAALTASWAKRRAAALAEIAARLRKP